MAVPQADAPGAIDYGSLNEDGQALGIEATITQDMLGTGSRADSRIRPPGWEGGENNHSRGHLLAPSLGGSGTDERNLITLTNSPVMSDFEGAIADAVRAGEVVNYYVTPMYRDDGMPSALVISARGSEGLELDIVLNNRDDS